MYLYLYYIHIYRYLDAMCLAVIYNLASNQYHIMLL